MYVCECKIKTWKIRIGKKACIKRLAVAFVRSFFSVWFFLLSCLSCYFYFFALFLRLVCLLSLSLHFEELIRVSHRTAVIFHFFHTKIQFRSFGLLLSVDESINTAFIPFIQ